MKGQGSAHERSVPDTSLDELIRKAIREKRLVRFRYSGRLRIAEPHDYGIQKGRARLLTYQLAGESSSGQLPDWRWFDMGGLSELVLLDQHFAGGRNVPTGKHHIWDELFLRVA